MPISFTKLPGWKMVGPAALWGASLVLVLQVHRLPAGNSHAVCGPWGCGPTLPALLSYHSFWLVLFSLPAVCCCRFLKKRQLLLLGGAAVLLGIAGIVGIVTWEATHWLPRADAVQKEYFLQRCLFSVATLIDVPLVQLILMGTAGLAVATLRSKPPTEPHLAED